MKRLLVSRRALLLALLLWPLAFGRGTEDLGALSWAFRGTVLVFPEDNGLESDPLPVLPAGGAALALPLAGPLWAEFSLDLYGGYYGYSEHLGRAVTLAIENRWTAILGFVTAPQLLLRFKAGSGTALRVYGGPAVDLRLCLIAPDLNDDEQEEAARQTGLVRDYFWGQGRWFFPTLGLGMDFGLSEKLSLGFDLRVWFPVYKLWTAEDLPPVEGWRFGAGIRVSLR